MTLRKVIKRIIRIMVKNTVISATKEGGLSGVWLYCEKNGRCPFQGWKHKQRQISRIASAKSDFPSGTTFDTNYDIPDKQPNARV
jgi:hypothetical protein